MKKMSFMAVALLMIALFGAERAHAMQSVRRQVSHFGQRMYNVGQGLQQYGAPSYRPQFQQQRASSYRPQTFDYNAPIGGLWPPNPYAQQALSHRQQGMMGQDIQAQFPGAVYGYQRGRLFSEPEMSGPPLGYRSQQQYSDDFDPYQPSPNMMAGGYGMQDIGQRYNLFQGPDPVDYQYGQPVNVRVSQTGDMALGPGGIPRKGQKMSKTRLAALLAAGVGAGILAGEVAEKFDDDDDGDTTIVLGGRQSGRPVGPPTVIYQGGSTVPAPMVRAHDDDQTYIRINVGAQSGDPRYQSGDPRYQSGYPGDEPSYPGYQSGYPLEPTGRLWPTVQY